MAGNSPVKLSVGKETFVVLREEDYKGWLETSYLLSSPENAKVLQEGLEAPLAQCKDLDDVLKW